MFIYKSMFNKDSKIHTMTHLIMALLLVVFSGSDPKLSGDAILGEWLSAKKDTRILIFKEGERYRGRVLWGTGSSPKDVKNPDPALRNRDVIGMVILNGFKYDGDGVWEKGTIYDPREGKTYDCKMTIKEDGRLNIRGYVGVSLFGRTEIWTRVK
jgi:uncharacterized protein (DUF2147 family)